MRELAKSRNREPVHCEAPGYPNRDVKGRVMYLNSHYATEAAAVGRNLEEFQQFVN